MRKIIAILTGIAVLVLVNWTIAQRERLLATGTVVRLQLAPVDPRSLMQGDYMALRFQVANDALGRVHGRDNEDGRIVVKPDQNGIARHVRHHDGKTLGTGEVLLRYRIREGHVKLGTNAWFFQEGHAKYYERARYGEFRVSPEGDMLLVGMLGEKQERLGPAPAPPLPTVTVKPVDPLPALTAGDHSTNSLGMTFVSVPGTSVQFCIHETRRQDYAAYASAVPGVDGSWKNQQREGIPCGDRDDHPVVGVSWADARAFCMWLSKKEGRTYRLPTDREWSIAIGMGPEEGWGAGSTPKSRHQKSLGQFPLGKGLPPKAGSLSGNYGDIAWNVRFPNMPFITGYNDGFATTAPAMSLMPDNNGLYNLGGNVWEWVEDWWDEAHRARALRGGSFFSGDMDILRSGYRGYQPPITRAYDFGFRCVLVAW